MASEPDLSAVLSEDASLPEMSWVRLWWTAPICQDVIIIMTSEHPVICHHCVCKQSALSCSAWGVRTGVSCEWWVHATAMLDYWWPRFMMYDPETPPPSPGPHQIVCANGFVRWWRWLCAAQLIRLQMSPAWHQSASRQICLIATMEIFLSQVNYKELTDPETKSTRIIVGVLLAVLGLALKFIEVLNYQTSGSQGVTMCVCQSCTAQCTSLS